MQAVVSITGEQKKILEQNGIEILYTEENAFFESLFNLEEAGALLESEISECLNEIYDTDRREKKVLRAIQNDESRFDDAARRVFEDVKENYNPELGINWDIIDDSIHKILSQEIEKYKTKSGRAAGGR